MNDTKKENDLIIHYIDKIPSDLSGKVRAKVDATKRRDTAWHHSATHFLHAALRKVLGTHVAQKGSLVNAEHLRFDFSHFAKMTDEEISEVEELVNEKIGKYSCCHKSDAKRRSAEIRRYGVVWRKVWRCGKSSYYRFDLFIELCGGTHVGATGEIGFFKIKNETAVAAGVRSIEAVCGKLAEEYVNEEFKLINTVRQSLKNPADISKAVEGLVNENSELKKRIEKLEASQLESVKKELLQKVIPVNGINFIGEIVEGNADALKKLCFDLKKDLNNYVVVLASNNAGKANVAVLLDDKVAASKNLEAPKIIKEYIAPLIKGGGGGQKTLATAGGAGCKQP